jgi:hypothetical protein
MASADASVANYIVLLDAAPTAAVSSTRGNSAAAEAYANTLKAEQAVFVDSVEAQFGRNIEVSYTMQYAVNGVVMALSAEEAALMARNPQVSLVEREVINQLLTDAGPEWIGAPDIWDGTASGSPALGDGIVVAVIDSGVNMDHPSFAETDKNGYTITNPAGAGNFFGACDPSNGDQYDPNSTCNNKLIGVYDMVGSAVEPNGEDEDGHGSHTASTAAGNFVDAELNPPALTPDLEAAVSGVAPHANLITFDVCEPGCPSTATLASLDEIAMLIQVDSLPIRSLNYSISGGQDPYNDAVEQGFLAVSDLGVFVAASAGNGGPGPGTMGHQSPWLNSTAASTHNRRYPNSLINLTGGTAPADMGGAGVTDGYGPETIVYAGDFVNGDADPEQCLNPFPAGTWEGEIVVCDRGAIARTAKGANVLAGGAGGFVLANVDANGESVNGDQHVLPAVHLPFSLGEELRVWLAANPVGSLVATIEGYQGVSLNPADGDIMADFSSRGPNTNIDVLKPNVTAPGVDILAAVADVGIPGPEVEWDYLSGTSMSSPHSAGAGALMAELHPDWSPHQIKSAIMMTATSDDVRKEDGVTPADPFDMGAGSVRVSTAAASGLVMDESTANFIASDPADGGDPKTLNVASMMNSGCLGTCSWTRTVESTTDVPIEWTVSTVGLDGFDVEVVPASFILEAAGDTASFTVTATATTAPTNAFTFGSVVLTPDFATPTRSAEGDPLPPVAAMPVAVQAATGQFPDLVTIQTDDAIGSYEVGGLVTTGVDPLGLAVSGLEAGTADMWMLSQDPTNGDPYDNLNDGTVEYINVTVAADDLRLVAEITASEGPDIDLFVGTGSVPSAGTEVCASTTGSWEEYCNITGEDLVAGEWWILVQNWNGSDAQPDAVTLMSAVVGPEDLGNMTASGPASAAPGEEFAIDLAYDVDPAAAGDRYYGVVALFEGDVRAGGFAAAFDVDLQIVDGEMLALDGPAVTFNLGIPGSFVVTDDAGEGLVWTVTGADSCVDDANWTGGSGLAACVDSDAYGTAAYDTSLVSNEVDFSESDSCTSVYLDFLTNYRDLTTPTGDRMDVDVSIDDGATWTTELTLDDDIGGFFALPGVPFEVDLSAYVGSDSLHVRFRYYNPDDGSGAWDWYAQVDDVALRCEQTPAAEITPEALSETLAVDEMSSDTLSIANVGQGDLTYSIYEDGGADGRGSAPQAILWEQAVNGTSGIISDLISDTGFGTYSAEDFVLSSASRIDLIFTPGFDNGGDIGTLADSISWYIFADDAGMPAGDPGSGNALWSHTDIPTGTGIDTTNNEITLDVVAATGDGVVLGAGRYWLVVAPEVPSDPVRWNWYQGEGQELGAMLFDEGNFGGLPWTLLTDLGVTFGDLAFRLEGETNVVGETCDVANDIPWLSVDPTTGVVAGGETADVNVMYDATGLTPDTYTGNLCVATNDAQNPLVIVPVELIVTDDPTAVEMASLSASVNADGSVTVDWATASETRNAGFNVYRSVSADAMGEALNSELIASTASAGAGAAYSFVDANVGSGVFYYWVEAVSVDGATTAHGPVEAVTQAPTSASLTSFGGNSSLLLSVMLVAALGVALLAGVVVNRRKA